MGQEGEVEGKSDRNVASLVVVLVPGRSSAQWLAAKSGRLAVGAGVGTLGALMTRDVVSPFRDGSHGVDREVSLPVGRRLLLTRIA